MRLTNEQVGAITRAHFNLKAMLRVMEDSVNDEDYPYNIWRYDNAKYAIEQLEEVFEWLDFHRTAQEEASH